MTPCPTPPLTLLHLSTCPPRPSCSPSLCQVHLYQLIAHTTTPMHPSSPRPCNTLTNLWLCHLSFLCCLLLHHLLSNLSTKSFLRWNVPNSFRSLLSQFRKKRHHHQHYPTSPTTSKLLDRCRMFKHRRAHAMPQHRSMLLHLLLLPLPNHASRREHAHKQCLSPQLSRLLTVPIAPSSCMLTTTASCKFARTKTVCNEISLFCSSSLC